MVKRFNKDGVTYFECGECGLDYEEEELAERCEVYCRAHHACSLEISELSIMIL